MDTDDYFWQPTNPPYTKKRNVDERLAMMKSDIEKAEKVVNSGSHVAWEMNLYLYLHLLFG